MKRILLTSGSDIFLKRNMNLLQEKGVQFQTTKSGVEALKILGNEQIDMLLADLQLTDMGGSSFCSQVRKEEKLQQLPVVLICLNVAGCIERAEQSGASAVLLKPIDPDQLLDTIGSFIDLQKGRNRRVLLKTEVLVKKPGMDFLCQSHDISNRGILIRTGQQLALGSRITCHFALPDSCWVEAEGEIIRTMNGPGQEHFYGVRFIDLNVAYRRAIDSYLYSKTKSLPKYRPLYTPQQTL